MIARRTCPGGRTRASVTLSLEYFLSSHRLLANIFVGFQAFAACLICTATQAGDAGAAARGTPTCRNYARPLSVTILDRQIWRNLCRRLSFRVGGPDT